MALAFDLLYMQDREIAVLCIWTARVLSELYVLCSELVSTDVQYNSQEMRSTQYEAF